MECAFFYTVVTCTYVTVHSSNNYGPLLTCSLINTSSTHLMLECLDKLRLLRCVEERIEGTEVLISVTTLCIAGNFKELFMMLYITSI